MKTINSKEITQSQFAFDGCHKIYLLDEDDIEDAKCVGYAVYPTGELKSCWRGSCYLRFISNWKLTEQYVRQGEKAVFRGRWK